MTPSEKWMLGLWAVYGIPSFLCGVGLTLLLVRWRDRRRIAGLMRSFLSMDFATERREPGATPADAGHGLSPDALRPG
jgi:hypothetical protein